MSDRMCADTRAAVASLPSSSNVYGTVHNFNNLGLTLTGCNSQFPHPHKDQALLVRGVAAAPVQSPPPPHLLPLPAYTRVSLSCRWHTTSCPLSRKK